ncbi:MAG TPA: STAS domain-containing protein [Deltaproteobacteria bacterium]|nr:STAS domain-containing protein [Deltaproteobacteria bacterium]
MVQFESKDSKEGRTLHIEGSLTIDQSCSLRDTLLEAFASTNRLIIDLERVSAIDTSCLQLLCTAGRSFVSAGKKISIKDDLPDIIKKALADVAIDRSACDSPCSAQCLWDKGGSDG